MAKKKTKVSSLKTKKKRWVPVVAPKIFKNIVIGESYVVDPESLVGRQLKVNMMSLTNDIKKQNMYAKLKVTQILNANAQTEVTGYNMIPAAVKRLVRRRRDKLDDSFVCKSADGKNVRLKPLILTRNKASGGAKNQLVVLNRQLLASYMAKNNFETLVSDVVMNKLQRRMKEQLSKIYPIRIYEIREYKVETGKIRALVKPEPEKKPVKKAVPKKEESVESKE